MQWSAEMFARLSQGVAFSPAATTPAGADERRRHPRVALGQRGQVRSAGGPWQTVLIRDLSADGVGLHAEAPMAPGRPFVLRLRGPGELVAHQPCVVRWCDRGGFETVAYFIGAAFLEPPPAQGPGPRRPTWMDDMLVDLRVRQEIARPS